MNEKTYGQIFGEGALKDLMHYKKLSKRLRNDKLEEDYGCTSIGGNINGFQKTCRTCKKNIRRRRRS